MLFRPFQKEAHQPFIRLADAKKASDWAAGRKSGGYFVRAVRRRVSS